MDWFCMNFLAFRTENFNPEKSPILTQIIVPSHLSIDSQWIPADVGSPFLSPPPDYELSKLEKLVAISTSNSEVLHFLQGLVTLLGVMKLDSSLSSNHHILQMKRLKLGILSDFLKVIQPMWLSLFFHLQTGFALTPSSSVFTLSISSELNDYSYDKYSWT